MTLKNQYLRDIKLLFIIFIDNFKEAVIGSPGHIHLVIELIKDDDDLLLLLLLQLNDDVSQSSCTSSRKKGEDATGDLCRF